MNKFLILTLAATAAFTMASCSDDDDNTAIENFDTPGGIEAIKAVNPLKVFTTGLPSSVNGQQIITDDSGRVIAIGSYTFTYFTNGSRAEDSYDGIMFNDYTSIYFRLNNQGFIKYAKVIYYEDDYEEYRISYNNNGNLSELKYYAPRESELKLKYNYEGSNVVSIPMIEDGREVFRFSVSYSNIINKGHYWIDPDILYVDKLVYFYYAGLLGIGSKNLPSKYTFGKDWFQTFQWTLNSDGYPSKLVTTLIEDGDFNDPDIKTQYFNW